MGTLFMNSACYTFFPVGQGLFSYGSISVGSNEDVFNWVYDCGTLSKKVLIDNGIKSLNKISKKQHIDVVFLSHFDNDHVNGIVRLLRCYSTSALVLPYITKCMRVALVANNEMSVSDEAYQLANNPIKFLREKGIKNVESIIFVPPPSKSVSSKEFFIKKEADDAASLSFYGEKLFGEESPIVYLQDVSKPILRSNVWKFYTLNAHAQKVEAEKLSNKIKLVYGSSDDFDDDDMLKLKVLYDNLAKKLRVSRNDISTYVFGMPSVGPRKKTTLNGFSKSFCVHDVVGLTESQSMKFSNDSGGGIFYGGDGCLKKSQEIKDFMNSELYKNLSRNCLCFQVMHHGSKLNYSNVVAGLIGSKYSIFSSKPSRYGHPHKSVRDSLHKNGPTQVDEEKGFYLKFNY